MQYGLALTCLAAIVQMECSILSRHGLGYQGPLQAPPLGSYRYQFRSVHHSSRGGFGGDNNGTWSGGGDTLKEIITNLHKLETIFFGNHSFFNHFHKNKRNRTKLAFPKWFESWPDFDDDSSSSEGDEDGNGNETDDPCGPGFFDFSEFDGIIMGIKKEINDFFSDMTSFFPDFKKNRNSTDSSEESDWVDEFLDDIKKSFNKSKETPVDDKTEEFDLKAEDKKENAVGKIEEQPT